MMRIANIHETYWSESLLGETTLDHITEALDAAVAKLPDGEYSREALSEGYLELRTRWHDGGQAAVPQWLGVLTRLTDEQEQKRGYWMPDGGDIQAAVSALEAVEETRTQLFPDGPSMLMPLLTRFYVYDAGAANVTTLVLNTSDGAIYAAFVHNTLDFVSAQQSAFTAGYLLYTVARVLANELGVRDPLFYYSVSRLLVDRLCRPVIEDALSQASMLLPARAPDRPLGWLDADNTAYDEARRAVNLWLKKGLGQETLRICR